MRTAPAALALLVLAAPTVPAQADLWLTYRLETVTTRMRTGEVFREEAERRLFVAERHARLDIQDLESFLVDLDNHTMRLFDHKKSTTETLSLPVNLDRLVSEAVARDYAELCSLLAPKFSEEEAETALVIVGRWKTRRHLLEVATHSKYSFEYETWTTSEIPLSEGMQKALSAVLRSFYELDPFARTWIDRALTQPGIPVRIRFKSDEGTVPREETWILQDAVEVPPDPARFEAPPGYAEKPFDVTRFVIFGAPTAPAPPQ